LTRWYHYENVRHLCAIFFVHRVKTSVTRSSFLSTAPRISPGRLQFARRIKPTSKYLEGHMSSLNYRLRAKESVDNAPALHEVRSRKAIAVAPAVRALTPYIAVTSQAAIEARPNGETTFKLDWNESTIAPSPRVSEAIQAHLSGHRDLNWYPQLGSKDLVDALQS